MAYLHRLADRRQRLGRPIRVGLVGAGQMGTGFVAQVSRVPGMQVSAVADIAPQRAVAAYRRAGCPDPLVGTDPDRLSESVLSGHPVAVNDATLLTHLPVDVVVEASGVPEVAAEVAMAALLAGKDAALLTVECDVTVGLVLANLARQMGRVYTVCRGDEPAEAKVLVDYARALGFDVVCAGKGKNNPLDRHATPDTLAETAAARGMNPKMLTSFVDGSKTMIEMAALANATGLTVSRRGLHGPAATVEQLSEVFRPAVDGGVLDHSGVVDYCTGPVAPGVFTVVHCSDAVVSAELDYLMMGPGPYYTFYRPYHLASIEAPLTVAQTVLDREPSLAPVHWMAEVAAIAKRDLKAGEVLDGIGGRAVYGLIEDAQVAEQEALLPLGLIGGATVLRDVPAGQPLTRDLVAPRDDTVLAALRRIQDRLVAGAVQTAEPKVTSAVPALAPVTT